MMMMMEALMTMMIILIKVINKILLSSFWKYWENMRYYEQQSKLWWTINGENIDVYFINKNETVKKSPCFQYRYERENNTIILIAWQIGEI